MEPNPCVSCGACCAFFRVSFYWSEAEISVGGITPSHLTSPISPTRVAMKGTDQSQPRCVCLEGSIGNEVKCTIYELRPSPCREFTASWADGQCNIDCNRARAHYSLAPILPIPVSHPAEIIKG